MQADEWLEHTGDVFGTIVCSQKQKVLLASSMLRVRAKTWWKSISDTLLAAPGDHIWEYFKEQFQRKFVPDHVRQKKESGFLNLKQGQMTVSIYVHTFLQLSKNAIDLVDTEEKKVKRFLHGLNPTYKKMVLASNKPNTFSDAVDKAFTAKEVRREEIAENAKKSSNGTTGSWFKKGGGQFKNKNKRQKFAPITEKNPSVRHVARLIGLKHVGEPLEHA